jgi:type VI protein secretion system component VasF
VNGTFNRCFQNIRARITAGVPQEKATLHPACATQPAATKRKRTRRKSKLFLASSTAGQLFTLFLHQQMLSYSFSNATFILSDVMGECLGFIKVDEGTLIHNLEIIK